jgi:hypothetical protein
VEPFTISIVGLTQAGVLQCTAGVAQTNQVTNSEGFTDLTGELVTEPSTPGLSFNGSRLVISSSTVPLPKGSNNISLKLIASKVIGATMASATTTVPLRIVAPTPTALTTAGPFEVTVGEGYSLQLATDVSTICPNQNIAIVGALPLGLNNIPAGLRKTGLITGTNTNTTSPWQFPVNVVADTSTFYEGGGTMTFSNVIFQLRNPAAPTIASELTRLVGVGSPFKQYSITTSSGTPSQFEASGLPPGLTLKGENINGTPTQAGNYEVELIASNYQRPGDSTSRRQPGTANLRIYVSGAMPLKTSSLFGVNDLRVGIPASLSAGEGLRVSGYGLPTGLSFDKATGLITGTPTVAGTFAATLFIQNGKGWISKTISLTVR